MKRSNRCSAAELCRNRLPVSGARLAGELVPANYVLKEQSVASSSKLRLKKLGRLCPDQVLPMPAQQDEG